MRAGTFYQSSNMRPGKPHSLAHSPMWCLGLSPTLRLGMVALSCDKTNEYLEHHKLLLGPNLQPGRLSGSDKKLRRNSKQLKSNWRAKQMLPQLPVYSGYHALYACKAPSIDWIMPKKMVRMSTATATQNVYHCGPLRRSNHHWVSVLGSASSYNCFRMHKRSLQ